MHDSPADAINRMSVIPGWVVGLIIFVVFIGATVLGLSALAGAAFERSMNAKTTNIAEYPAAVSAWREHMPELVAHMPAAIPTGATAVQFEWAAPAMQAPDHIALYVIVSPAQVRATLAPLVPTAIAPAGREDGTIRYFLEQFGSASATNPLPGQSVIVYETAYDGTVGFVWGNLATGEVLYYAMWD